MKFLQNLLAMLATLAIIIFVGWLVYWLTRYVIDQFNVVDTSKAAVLTIIAVITITCTIIIAGAIRSIVKTGDKPIHPEKAIIYKQFIDFWYDPGFFTDANMRANLMKSMALWASDGVLKHFLTLQKLGHQPDKKNKSTSRQLEKVIREMRRDLGQKNFGIIAGSIDAMLNIEESSDNENI